MLIKCEMFPSPFHSTGKSIPLHLASRSKEESESVICHVGLFFSFFSGANSGKRIVGSECIRLEIMLMWPRNEKWLFVLYYMKRDEINGGIKSNGHNSMGCN